MITLQQELRKIVQISKGKRIDKSSEKNQSKRSLLNEFENNCSVIQDKIRSRKDNLSKHQKSGIKVNKTNNENSIHLLNTLNSTKSYNSANTMLTNSNRTSSKSINKREPLKVSHKDPNEAKPKLSSKSKPLTTTKKLNEMFNDFSPPKYKEEKVFFNNLLSNQDHQKLVDEKTFKKSENIETFSFNNFPREYFSEHIHTNFPRHKYEEQDQLKIIENEAFSKRKLDFSSESKKSSQIFMNSDLEYEQLINEKEDKPENIIASPKYNLFIDEPIMEMPDESTKNTKPFSYHEDKEEKTQTKPFLNEQEFTKNYQAIKFDNYDEEEKTQFKSELNCINEKFDSNQNYENFNDRNDRNYENTQPMPVFSGKLNEENDKPDNGSPTKIENKYIKPQDSIESVNMIIDPNSQYLDYPEGNTISMLNVNNSIQFSKPYLLNGNISEQKVFPEVRGLNFKKKIEETLETKTESLFNSRIAEDSGCFAFNSFHEALKSYKSSGNFKENSQNDKEKQGTSPKLITSEIIYLPINNENRYQPSSFFKKLDDSNFKNQHYSDDVQLVQSNFNDDNDFNDELIPENPQTYEVEQDHIENKEKDSFYYNRTNEYEFSNKNDRNNELQNYELFNHNTNNAIETQNNNFKAENYYGETPNINKISLFSSEEFKNPNVQLNKEAFLPSSLLFQQNNYCNLKLSSTQNHEDQLYQEREENLNSLISKKDDNLEFLMEKKEDNIPKLDISKASKLAILKSQENFASPSFGNSYNFEIEANFLIPLTSDRSLFTTENNENNEEDKIPSVEYTFPATETNDKGGRNMALNEKNINSNENQEQIENIKNKNFYSIQAEGRVREEADILSEIKKMVEFGSAEEIVGEIFSEASLVKISKTYFKMKMEVILFLLHFIFCISNFFLFCFFQIEIFFFFIKFFLFLRILSILRESMKHLEKLC